MKKVIIICGLMILSAIILFPSSILGNSKIIAKTFYSVPESVLFKIDNFKPGDWAERELFLYNDGPDNEYFIFIDNVRGDKAFLNELQIKIEYNNVELFQGTINDFKGIDRTFIKENENHKYFITVEFPYDLGNEYQGLTSQFDIGFYVKNPILIEDKESGELLPNTSTNTFNIMLIGGGLLIIGTLLIWYRRICIK